MEGFISVIAKLKILTSDNGGKRKTGIKSGYRPNHVFQTDTDKPFIWIGEITFDDRKLIFPGDEIIATVKFIKSDEVEQFLQIGKAWQIFEMPNLIGEAVVLEMI